MEIIESWEDHNGKRYAIVRHSKEAQKEFNGKEFEAVWLDENDEKSGLYSFGGTVGFTIAEFDTIKEARSFLLKGISGDDDNPEIWLEMVEVNT